MNQQARIETLKTRHADLEGAIAAEYRRPAPDSDVITRNKIEKLRLKEQMEHLERLKAYPTSQD